MALQFPPGNPKRGVPFQNRHPQQTCDFLLAFRLDLRTLKRIQTHLQLGPEVMAMAHVRLNRPLLVVFWSRFRRGVPAEKSWFSSWLLRFSGWACLCSWLPYSVPFNPSPIVSGFFFGRPFCLVLGLNALNPRAVKSRSIHGSQKKGRLLFNSPGCAMHRFRAFVP